MKKQKNTFGTCSAKNLSGHAPELNEHVKQTFEFKFANCLRDMFYQITKRMNGVKPKWLNEDVHEAMMEIVANDPIYKKRSEQNKKNRRGGSMENVVESTHFQGFMSAVQHAKRMAEKKPRPITKCP